jgi:hypothetical protein
MLEVHRARDLDLDLAHGHLLHPLDHLFHVL